MTTMTWIFEFSRQFSKNIQRVNLELLVADYDRIGSSDPIGKVLLGYNRKGLELKHWKEMIENPRRPIVHWHVLKVNIFFKLFKLSSP
jgi:synaptotagmin-1